MTNFPEPNSSNPTDGVTAVNFEQLVLPNVEPFDEDGDGDEPGGDNGGR